LLAAKDKENTMKRTLCIGLTAVLAFACNGKNNDRSANGSTSTPAAQSGSGTAADTGVSARAANSSDQLVTLTGCLQGDRNVVGTSGSASGSPSNNTGAAASGRFVLANASAGTSSTDLSSANAPSGSSAGSGYSASRANGSGSAGSATGSTVGTSGTNGTGVGANGAGGSGGPLVSGMSSYTLVGNTSELSSHVNQQVRITGRLSSSTTGYESTGAATGSGSTSGTGSANSGSAGSGVGAGSSGTAAGSASGVGTTSSASGQYSATNNQSGNSGAGMRTVTVESVQMVSSNCSSPR
jgi:hypothetical protein